MNKTIETKLFSEILKSKGFSNTILKMSGGNNQIAKDREGVYAKLFSNYVDYREQAKSVRMFSGYSDFNNQANQFFNASVTSYLNSFAGFLAIERAMDQPNQLLGYLDVVGVSDGRMVMPNLGAENRTGIQNRISSTTTTTNAQQTYSIALGKVVIPRSLKVKITIDGTAYSGIDNGEGKILMDPGVLTTGTINYTSGAVNLVIVPTIDGDDTILITATEDAAAVPDVAGNNATYSNRVKANWKQINIPTYPDLLIAEHDLTTQAMMKKSVGQDPAAFMAVKLTELYTKLINDQLVAKITGDYTGNTTAIDVSNATTGHTDYTSKIQEFGGGLVDVDKQLAKASYKGVKATAYLCGEDVAAFFQKCKSTGEFVANTDSTYVNDLIGYYNGVPVLKHLSVTANTGYAIHKTADGMMAPVCRGIFLPLTDTPPVGNYANPTQLASGVFYQEGTESITSDLTRKFTLAV